MAPSASLGACEVGGEDYRLLPHLPSVTSAPGKTVSHIDDTATQNVTSLGPHVGVLDHDPVLLLEQPSLVYPWAVGLVSRGQAGLDWKNRCSQQLLTMCSPWGPIPYGQILCLHFTWQACPPATLVPSLPSFSHCSVGYA